MTLRTRFAPSPTGYLHIGGARIALYSWLYARKHGGAFILRIEDTDLERSTAESVNAILEGMTWLGLEYDEGPFYQTQHFPRYKEVIDRMLNEGTAYHCYCSKERLEALRNEQMASKEKPRYDGKCRLGVATPPKDIPPVVRFKNPIDGETVVEDLIKGRVVFKNSELDDLIIARSDGTPTYNFTVVVDDMDMKISHVIRGDDHLNNTPRQMTMLKALGYTPPMYAHAPMILAADGSRLSKRHGSVSVMQYRDEGFLPEALLNYLVRLGWSHGDQEIFSMEEMIQLFEVTNVHRSAAAFNPEKLLWLNQQYIKTSSPEHVARHLSWHLSKRDIDPSAGPDIVAVVKIHQERAKTLVELADSVVCFYKDFSTYEEKAATKHFSKDGVPVLHALREHLATLEPWTPQEIHRVIGAVAEKHGMNMGKLAQPLRVALTGTAVSPPIDVTTHLIGKARVLTRIEQALRHIEGRVSSQV